MASTQEVARNLSNLLEGEVTPLPKPVSSRGAPAGGSPEEPTPGIASSSLEGAGTTITLTVEHLQALISAAAQGKPSEGGGGATGEKRKSDAQSGRSMEDDELQMLPPSESEGMAGTPFTARLQYGELPATYRPVTYEYTGTTDPWEHLSRFVTSASLHKLTDGRDSEPLRSYVQRFNAATLEVPVTSEEVLINALAQGLQMGEFFDSLSKKAPVSFNDLLRRAEKYINAEEARRSRTFEPVPTRPRFENYAPLSTAPSEILTAIVNHPKLKWPRTYSEVPKKPASAGPYCRFHNEHGHSTDECQHLRDEIERRIRMKNLSEFVENSPRSTAKYPRKGGNGSAQIPGRPGKDTDPQPPNNYIHTIFGGPMGGDSNRSRRAHLRELQELRGELAMMYRVSIAPPITFGIEDETGIQQPHNDALVITAMVANYDVARILVDTGSSADIIYYECFKQMRLNFEVRRVDTALIGFAGEVVQPMGEVTLPVSLGTDPLKATRAVRFLIIDAPSSYNMIMGRPSMNAFEAVVSTFHMKMKFPVLDRVGEVRGDQETSRRCYNQALRGQRRINPMAWDKGATRHGCDDIGRAEEKRPRVDPEEKEEAHVQPMEELKVIQLDLSDPTRTTKIGTALSADMAEELSTFLRLNQDVFAWSPKDLKGIDPTVVVHELNLRPEANPVKQKRRHFGPEKDKIIEGEVRKLLEAGHIKEIRFPTWLSNAVLVKKAEGKWRMCIDFRDLNQACPKDHYPLPRIDQLVDSTAGCAMLSMMGASQGYHQIRLSERDQPSVSFVTSTGTYCYVVMPFGLKNAGATYQRLVDTMFREQLGRNMEVYVDDMLVKSEEAESHIEDLKETFATLRRYGMKLNPLKCAFGVEAGKFLGYMVTKKGVEANPEKIRAVMDMRPPKSIKEVQTLAGRITALSRFISRAADASYPFFKILRKGYQFEWGAEADHAFEQLKETLARLPLLAKPRAGEKLYVYLAAGEQAVSAVLLSEREGVQRPIYYVSRMLKGAERRYAEIEKIGMSLVVTARKLRPYFLSHSIVVRTNFPLRSTLGRMDVSGRMVKWAVELGQFDIEYESRTAIKGQALAEFLQETIRKEPEAEWNVFIDGSSNQSGSGAGIMLVSPTGEEYEYAVRLTFRASNNEAEYEALIYALQLAAEAGADCLEVYSDSQLVVQQMKGVFETKDERMGDYCDKAKRLSSNFRRIILKQIPRSENERADFLARVGSLSTECGSRRITILQGHPRRCEEVAVASAADDWRMDIIRCLGGYELPCRREQSKLVARSRGFCLDCGLLYKRGFTRPHLKCLSRAE
ncbi:PREDICTED: uncharacterized protein LOC105968491 [Erythranthe guttata]|uniref:uncharacterized protein LOC105968491 n=1 Tax=Erythranthe guttata TaxID=4155 RepID=UPI00064D94BA|nr:PREDICTED: uncharacterized protein LOC105968491 [Erythranthe guttata]|eukprot:XP_012848582.1 PREDICTED: uncharacterized protein LOC105968491 [Erythranthe guttata]